MAEFEKTKFARFQGMDPGGCHRDAVRVFHTWRACLSNLYG